MLSGGAANALTAAESYGTYTFTYSDAFGTGNFGYVDVTGTVADTFVYVNVAPNWIIDTGGPHQPLAFNLNGGTIFDVQLNTLFGAAGGNGASPFGAFTNTIVSLDPPLGCDNGGSNGGCGVHELSFHVSNFAGFSGTAWDGKQVYFAADILLANCEGACTGNIGTTAPVPGPIVGAGLPGLAAVAMFGLNFWRRRRNNGGLAA
jgi:hypothetical protein